MSNGSVISYGSLRYLKLQMDLGYNITITKLDMVGWTDIEQFVEEYLPDAAKKVNKVEIIQIIRVIKLKYLAHINVYSRDGLPIE